MATGDTSPRRTRRGTAEKLVRAAAGEFNERGFLATDTNRIARRAGFAPQTFYRWFQDKTEVFIRVYEQWQQEEAGVLQRLLAKDASDARLVQAVVAHHRAYLIFRRSLRRLSVEDDDVRKARAQARLNRSSKSGAGVQASWTRARRSPSRSWKSSGWPTRWPRASSTTWVSTGRQPNRAGAAHPSPPRGVVSCHWPRASES